MRRSWPILEGHPVNRERIGQGKLPANSIWLWGQGKQPTMPPFLEQYGRKGGIISAVDLLRGIGTCLGWEVLPVPGITGYLDTNYRGKAEKALEALNDLDLVFVHVEAPDESSHEGSLENKIKAIEDFDREIVGRVWEGHEGLRGLRPDGGHRSFYPHFPDDPYPRTRPDGRLSFGGTPPEPPDPGLLRTNRPSRGKLAFPKGDELMSVVSKQVNRIELRKAKFESRSTTEDKDDFSKHRRSQD